MRDDLSMSKAAQKILDEFEALPETDRNAVAAEILRRSALDHSTLDDADNLTDEQREEIDRRLAEHAQNPASAIPWEVGRKRLYRRFA